MAYPQTYHRIVGPKILLVMISSEKDQLVGLISRTIDPGKSKSLKETFDAFIVMMNKKSVVTPSDFYGYVNNAKADEEWWNILQEEPKFRDDRLVWAKVKEIWRATETLVKAGKDKEMTKEELEAPLDKATVLSLNTAWDDRYGNGSFKISPYLHPSDSLMGKIYREYKRNQPTIIKVKKALSLFMMHKPDDGDELEVGGGLYYRVQQTGEVKIRNVPDYYEGLRILAYGQAKAGNFVVTSNQTGRKVVYAPLDTNLDYADMGLRAAFLTNKDPLERLDWLQEQDHLTRGAMCALMRQGWTQGEALTQAIKEHGIEWKISTLRIPQQLTGEADRRTWTGGKGNGNGGGKGKWVSYGDKGKGKGQGKGDQWGKGKSDKWGSKVKKPLVKTTQQNFCSHFKGKEICKGFNDGRCKARSEKDCPKKQLHCCDVRLPNGKACGGNHMRSQHRY